jgi:hypothetical protein
MQLTPMRFVSGWIRSTITSLRRPSPHRPEQRRDRWILAEPDDDSRVMAGPPQVAQVGGPIGGVSGLKSDQIGTRSGGRRIVTFAMSACDVPRRSAGISYGK